MSYTTIITVKNNTTQRRQSSFDLNDQRLFFYCYYIYNCFGLFVVWTTTYILAGTT
jgi:hypothetical protein